MAKGKKSGGRDFKPGVSGNPQGRPKLTEKEKIVSKLTKETWNDLCEKMMRCTKEQLEELIAAEVPYESELFIRHMLALGEKPDWHAYEKYLARRIGKLKEEVEVLMPKPTVIPKSDGSQIELGTKLEEDE